MAFLSLGWRCQISQSRAASKDRRKTQLHMDQVWVLPHGGGQRTDPRGGHQHCQEPRWCQTDTEHRMESNLLFGIPEIQVGSGKAHSECTAQQNLSNEGAEMQQVLLSVSFNHRKKRTYGFVTLVYHTRKLFLHPLICSIHSSPWGFWEQGSPQSTRWLLQLSVVLQLDFFSSLSLS